MNPYCTKFVRNPKYVEDLETGIRYLNRKDLEQDQNCQLVCTKINM
jgi:hypothetical protein